MITTLVMTVILGSALMLSNQSQGSKQYQEDLLTIQQSLREASDQMYRDMRMAGYPQARVYALSTGWTASNSNRIAYGFRSINSTSLVFEGDIDNDGFVEVVEYNLGGNMLRRSEVKKNSDGSIPAADYQLLAENVNGLTFSYYTWSGGSWTTVGVNATNVKRIDVSLTLRTAVLDPYRKQYGDLNIQTSVVPRNLE